MEDAGAEPAAWAAACRLRVAPDLAAMVRWAQAETIEAPPGERAALAEAAEMEVDDEIPELNAEEIHVKEGRALLVFMHGAGQSSQTWATTVAELKRMLRGQEAPALVAYDARAHGATRCLGPDEYDSLTKDNLVADAVALIEALCAGQGDSKPAHVFLAGHSMGGAIACWVAQALQGAANIQVRGLFVMDAVEELALASLSSSLATVTNRPPGFASLEAAVAWALEHGMTQNPISAQASIRGQLRVASTEEARSFGAESGYVWRTALAKSYEHWPGWFQGFSQAFVDIKLINKSILLAGRERLDQPMMVGHMQGKFKLIVFPEVRVGHFVHEDAPVRTAQELAAFLRRRVSLPAFLRGSQP